MVIVDSEKQEAYRPRWDKLSSCSLSLGGDTVRDRVWRQRRGTGLAADKP